jgi:hypothetical protein
VQVFVATLVTIIASSLLADGLKGERLFEGWFEAETTQRFRIHILLGTLLVWIVAALWLYGLRRLFLPALTLTQGRVVPRRVLIMMVSPKGNAVLDPSPCGLAVTFTGSHQGSSRTIPLTGDLDADVQALNDANRWSWHQLLRALRPHQKKGLERVYLIGSTDQRRDDGSIAQGTFSELCECAKLLKLYVPEVRCYGQAVGAGSLDEFQQAILAIVRSEGEHGVKEKDIIIDVTGGQKTHSIAGALVTLSAPRLEFQYVDTNDPFGVVAYNVVNESRQHAN